VTLIALLLTLCFGSVPADREIILAARATTPGTRMLLRDFIADEHEAGLPTDLLDTDLGRAPSPCFPRIVDRRYVQSLMPSHRVGGATSCSVTADTVTITRVEIERIAREFLVNSPLVARTTAIEIVRSPSDFVVARGRTSRQLAPKVRGKLVPRGPVTVQVDVQVDGALVRTSTVGFDLRTQDTIAVLATDLPRGSELTAEHVRWIQLDTTNVVAVHVAPDLVLGQIARRDLKAGVPLRLADFAPETLVKRGDLVRIVFKRGGLELAGRGIAKANATLGESIRLENADTKQPLVGRVAGPGIVVVDP
jgi:flagellar basal body P-ring formation protein FlgA